MSPEAVQATEPRTPAAALKAFIANAKLRGETRIAVIDALSRAVDSTNLSRTLKVIDVDPTLVAEKPPGWSTTVVEGLCERGMLSAVSLALSRGLPVDAELFSGRSRLLLWACDHGDFPVASLALPYGASPASVGGTPEGDSDPLVRACLRLSVSLKSSSGDRARVALDAAKTARALLSYGAPVSNASLTRLSTANHPLQRLAELSWGDLKHELTGLIVDFSHAGVDFSAPVYDGLTITDLAARETNLDMVFAIARSGANLRLTDPKLSIDKLLGDKPELIASLQRVLLGSTAPSAKRDQTPPFRFPSTATAPAAPTDPAPPAAPAANEPPPLAASTPPAAKSPPVRRRL